MGPGQQSQRPTLIALRLILFHNDCRGVVFAEYCFCSIIKGFRIIMNIGNNNLIQNHGLFGYKTTSLQGISIIYGYFSPACKVFRKI